MIYQQEIKEINSFYSKYKDKKIVYSKEVSQQIGIIQRDTAIKVGDFAIKGALISSTMESFVILAKLNDLQKQTLHEQNGSPIVQLKFLSHETGKTLLFTIHTKFLNINNQGLAQKDLQFVAMQIRRKIPNDLIRIFGLYHQEAANILNDKKKKVECMLLANDIKVDCITLSISKTELVLILEDSRSITINQKAIAILKVVNTGEVVEIIGNIAKRIQDPDEPCQIHLQYSMDDQSPRFGYSVHVLKSLINH